MRLSTGVLLFLVSVPALAEKGGDPVKLVEYFLKTPTGDLKPELVPYFMELDAKALPAKLQDPYRVKREELSSLRKIAEGNKKMGLKRLGQEEKKDCAPEEVDDRGLKVLKEAGYEEIYEHEEVHVLQKTSCTECELVDEFTLRLLLLPPKKKGEKKRRVYLLHQNDPLWTYVGALRNKNDNPFGTNFFGIGGGPKCR